MGIIVRSIFSNTVVALGLGLVGAGCSSSPLQLESEPVALAAAADVRADTAATFRLRPGQTAAVGGHVLVSFRGIKSDSRCPAGAACVWAGDAEAVVGVATERGSWTWTSLHTGMDPRSVGVHGFSIKLVDVEPGAVMNASISPERYVAVLEVARQ